MADKGPSTIYESSSENAFIFESRLVQPVRLSISWSLSEIASFDSTIVEYDVLLDDREYFRCAYRQKHEERGQEIKKTIAIDCDLSILESLLFTEKDSESTPTYSTINVSETVTSEIQCMSVFLVAGR